MKKRGFTLLELLLSLTIFSVIIGAVTGVFLSSQRTKQRVDQLVQAQQSARTAIDYMIKDLRAAGYNIDIDESMTSTPQRRIVYASAYEVVFNANILPSEASPASPLEPSAMKVTPTERPAHYYPVTKYNTGAETVVFTLDWDNDGLINANDRDGSPAIFTDNPNDYCLIKRVYGEWDDGSNIKTLVEGIEGWTNQEVVSIVAGPDRYPSQSEGTPIFGYWIDNDGDPVTPPELFGDTDGDGELSEAEGNSLSPITNYEILDKIELITVNVTGVSQSPFQGEYTETSIKTDVSVTRNVSIKVFLAKGHVYLDENTDGIYDTGEPGLENMKVRLSTGETSITDENGIWTFAIIPGTYGVSVSPDILYRGTTALNFDFTVKNESADFTLDSVYKNFFGMDSTPSANIKGVIFHDLNSDGLWQTEDEPGLSDIQVSVWNNNTSSVSSPADSVGTYDLLANAEETLYVWVIPPDSFASSGVDIIDQLGYTTGSPVVSALSTSAAMVYMQEAEVSYVAFGLLA
ncbi:MAG: SdrD B-like domain-containing protein, partial [bacterium]|nr:SdrD B-like domain-containing protein [bacterium]